MLRVSEAHTPGCYNQKADAQPRRCTKWKFNPELFYKIIEFGKPHTGPFTSRINSHSEKYCIHHRKLASTPQMTNLMPILFRPLPKTLMFRYKPAEIHSKLPLMAIKLIQSL